MAGDLRVSRTTVGIPNPDLDLNGNVADVDCPAGAA